MKKKITVVVKEPGQSPAVQEIENTLEAFQGLVGGYIEVIRFTEKTLLICNSEGKFVGLPGNIVCGSDVIVGTIVICADKGEHFAGLTAQQQEKVMSLLSIEITNGGAI